MQIRHLASIWLESWLFRHSILILHPVFLQEHLSRTFQYLLEDLQNRAALQRATAPRAELSGNAGATAYWRVMIWHCGFVYHLKQQSGIMLKIGTLTSACGLAITTSDALARNLQRFWLIRFSLRFGKNIMPLHFLLGLFIISNRWIRICSSACIYFLIMLINKSRLVLLRAVTLAPAGG